MPNSVEFLGDPLKILPTKGLRTPGSEYFATITLQFFIPYTLNGLKLAECYGW